jgi:peptidoglycan/xylan/chitin deacetylase (PgdA/CDA1 family)
LTGADSRRAHFRRISRERTPEFVTKGVPARHVFPHRVYYLPKCGPDGLEIATRIFGSCRPDQCWEVVLYAEAEAIAGLPAEIFFDPDLVWHQQHFGRPGQIATANLVVRDGVLHSAVHLADLVQRIPRRREHKTQVENRFRGWVPMLVNAVVHFARERGLRTLRFATADLALRHTDRAREPKREMFERIYDRRLHELLAVERRGDWWQTDLDSAARRTVVPEPGSEAAPGAEAICVCHDIERGLGHAGIDAERALHGEREGPRHLEEMLAIEARLGVRATYNVVGCLLEEVRPGIEQGGHALGFHSFDHRLPARGVAARLRGWLTGAPEGSRQLELCRGVDYRLRGYRPPQSRLTPELSDDRLCRFNFEWLASSSWSFGGRRQPELSGRLVRLPILFDDYDLYRKALSWEEWEARALAAADRESFLAFSLHDCYGDLWLPRYERLLEAMMRRRSLRTIDEVADGRILAAAAPPPALAA